MRRGFEGSEAVRTVLVEGVVREEGRGEVGVVGRGDVRNRRGEERRSTKEGRVVGGDVGRKEG